ncbi:putative ferroxidase [Rosa chinensis]|uniref:Putative ferroxidase n=1 Tax=Rosa chinensis TaxID=74649 RepID=A0A2P6PNR8_ROSCH|nr:ferritin-4, chloroplastic [Rosa chinensis]PRQ23577.1 putative ferroxidase [Rosa chinensis]
MYAYFDRNNVALRGLALPSFSRNQVRKREVMNKRGGRVKLQTILMPLSEFDHAEKGDALYGSKVKSLPAVRRCFSVVPHEPRENEEEDDMLGQSSSESTPRVIQVTLNDKLPIIVK